jgi:hypothetical protein
MRKLILVAGVAALALTSPAAAKPDKGGGHGGQAHAEKQRGGGQKAQRGGGGKRQAQQAARGGGGQRSFQAQRGGGQKAQRGGGGQRQAQRVERSGGSKRQAQRVEHRGGGQRFANFQGERGHGNRNAQRTERRGNGNKAQRLVQSDRGHNRNVQRAEKRGNGNREFRVHDRGNERLAFDNRGRGNGNRGIRLDNRGNGQIAFDDRGKGKHGIRFVNRGFDQRVDTRGKWNNREFQVADRDFAVRVLGPTYFNPRSFDRVRNTVYFMNSGLPAAYYGGCPAGLAWDSWSCVPPYYAETTFVGRTLPGLYASNYFPQSLRYMYADTPDYYYRYGDGYVYRVNRSDNLIAALLPLIGAGLGVGMPFPYQGPQYYVPSYYQSFYPNYGSGNDYYRYANGYVYEIDGRSGYIEDVIPLLDRGYGVGQMLPAGYSYYNVPYQYRDVYYDTPNYNYRYAPGAIYQVDADTQLVTSIASLLTGGLAVGQALPPAYSVYNVPIAYRNTYYDRPDAWYRYSDGYIYQVDPTTQLITAIVRSIV